MPKLSERSRTVGSSFTSLTNASFLSHVNKFAIKQSVLHKILRFSPYFTTINIVAENYVYSLFKTSRVRPSIGKEKEIKNFSVNYIIIAL